MISTTFVPGCAYSMLVMWGPCTPTSTATRLSASLTACTFAGSASTTSTVQPSARVAVNSSSKFSIFQRLSSPVSTATMLRSSHDCRPFGKCSSERSACRSSGTTKFPWLCAAKCSSFAQRWCGRPPKGAMMAALGTPRRVRTGVRISLPNESTNTCMVPLRSGCKKGSTPGSDSTKKPKCLSLLDRFEGCENVKYSTGNVSLATQGALPIVQLLPWSSAQSSLCFRAQST
mmetsp:Transcript_42772/g.99025  ORF Transcript_42772/g.99025 Transcript_42772/m.99025 type:complete len:231 (+) Transcript_42772:279-971(+)